MERLTFDGNFCDIAQCKDVPGGSFCEDGYCTQRKVWERLKKYEDTGLEPGEIHALARYAVCDKAICSINVLNKAIMSAADRNCLASLIANVLIKLQELMLVYGIDGEVRERMEPKSSFKTNG